MCSGTCAKCAQGASDTDEGVRVLDRNEYDTVGSVLLMNMYHVPPGKTQYKKWKMRTIDNNSLQELSFPFADAPRVPDPNDPDKTVAPQAGVAPWVSVREEIANRCRSQNATHRTYVHSLKSSRLCIRVDTSVWRGKVLSFKISHNKLFRV